ncbi:MAG: 2-dehydropantoate 2-reductase [Alicyclobacillus sp.]|nr:2-dehydropantoate 2-reductase [Alicyclobacillus sp.]
MQLTIVGAGAIGGVLGAYLKRGGHDVTFCDLVEPHVQAIRGPGLRIEGPDETFTVQAPAYTPDELLARGEPLRTVLLCVKSQDTERAIRQLLPLVGTGTQVVSCQNGLCEDIIASVIGVEKTIGCFVNFSADYLEPGRILYGGVSALYLGEVDQSISPRVLELQRALSCWGPVQVTDNILGYLWGKLSYAALLFATAMVDATMAEVVRSLPHRDALLELTSEVLEVADLQGIRPMGFDDWEPSLVYPRDQRDPQALADQLERLALRMASNKKTKSGIWRDLAVRKRRTEVDFQLTPVVQIGERLGRPMPLTRFVIAIIHQLEDGAPMSWHHLDRLAELYEVEGGLRRSGDASRI